MTARARFLGNSIKEIKEYNEITVIIPDGVNKVNLKVRIKVIGGKA